MDRQQDYHITELLINKQARTHEWWCGKKEMVEEFGMNRWIENMVNYPDRKLLLLFRSISAFFLLSKEETYIDKKK